MAHTKKSRSDSIFHFQCCYFVAFVLLFSFSPLFWLSFHTLFSRFLSIAFYCSVLLDVCIGFYWDVLFFFGETDVDYYLFCRTIAKMPK